MALSRESGGNKRVKAGSYGEPRRVPICCYTSLLFCLDDCIDLDFFVCWRVT